MRSSAAAFESQQPFRGLGEADAQARLKAEGYNELPQPDRRTPFRIAIEVLREPMLALLLVGGIVYLLLGDLKEAIILVVFATMSIVITVVQETRTERVLEALRDLTSPRALVIRDGQRQRIAGRDVVRGDLIVLSEGDRVPADAVLLQCQDLQADELTLTGESVPVRKVAWDNRAGSGTQRPGGDDLPQVFSGSLVVRGSGLAEVTAIGPRSEIGRIGQSLAALEIEPPRLQAQTRRLVSLFAIVGGGVSVLAVLLYGLMRGGWLDAVLAGIALGMSMLPEELPVVLTVFMAMGAWRISLARVLTRRAAAIETLGFQPRRSPGGFRRASLARTRQEGTRRHSHQRKDFDTNRSARNSPRTWRATALMCCWTGSTQTAGRLARFLKPTRFRIGPTSS